MPWRATNPTVSLMKTIGKRLVLMGVGAGVAHLLNLWGIFLIISLLAAQSWRKS